MSAPILYAGPFPRVSSAHSKVGLTMAQAHVQQSAPVALDPPALPPVSKRDVRFWRFLRPVTLTFDLPNCKFSLHLLVTWVTSMPFLFLLRFFVFELRARTGQTDGEYTLRRPYKNATQCITEIQRLHSYAIIALCHDYNCDSTTIRLRSDYDVNCARLLPFDAIRHEQKMNMSIFHRSHVVVVSQSNRTQIVISITSVVIECVVVSSYRSRIASLNICCCCAKRVVSNKQFSLTIFLPRQFPDICPDFWFMIFPRQQSHSATFPGFSRFSSQVITVDCSGAL